MRATLGERQRAGAAAAFGSGAHGGGRDGRFQAGCQHHCQGAQAAVAKEACRDGISEGWWGLNLHLGCGRCLLQVLGCGLGQESQGRARGEG